MFGSEILDVAIGLAFVFLLLSLACSAIRELVEGWFKTRAVYLERGIFELLGRDRGLVEALYNHPMIAGLFQGDYVPEDVAERKIYNRTTLPTYIPAGHFAEALLDIAAHGRPGGRLRASVDISGSAARITAENVRSTIRNLGEPGVERVVLSALDRADGDVGRARAHLENWFNGAMDRVSGWYKRRTQVYLFAFGAVFAVALNADTIQVARHLYRDASARDALVEMADAALQDTSVQRAAGSAGTDTTGSITRQELLARIDRLQLPLGWREHAPNGSSQVAFAALGWLITALAVSLGAPFWFDLLNKFMVVRSTVKPHEKSPEEASEDRQSKAARRALLFAPQTVGSAAAGAVPGEGASGAGGPSDAALLNLLPDSPSMEVPR